MRKMGIIVITMSSVTLQCFNPQKGVITYCAPGDRSIVMNMSVRLFVCVFVCLSASISPELHVQSSPNFCACCLQPVAQ